jgi:hypothetical protein
MQMLGVPLRAPRFNEITASTVMGTGLWIAMVGTMHVLHMPLERADAGALLIVVVWACIGARMGIHVEKGARHLMLNLLVSAGLLGLYEGACACFGG